MLVTFGKVHIESINAIRIGIYFRRALDICHILRGIVGLVVFAACGNVADQSSKDSGILDAVGIADSTNASGAAIVYEGQHYGYVVSAIGLPLTQPQSREYGLGLGSANSSMPDGVIDNAAGLLLSILPRMPYFQVVSTMVSSADLQTTSRSSSHLRM
jgi:hypothetical protein